MIVVLGGLRSGSSVVARMLHNLGVLMGGAQAFALPGFWHSDFEDVMLARLTTDAYARGAMPGVKWFESYIGARMQHFATLRGIYPLHIQAYGVKGQLLALYHEQLIRAAGRLHVRLRFVVATREPDAVDASIVRCAAAVRDDLRELWIAQMREMNERIVKAIEPLPSVCRVRFEDRTADATATALRLVNRLGLTPNERMLEGVI